MLYPYTRCPYAFSIVLPIKETSGAPEGVKPPVQAHRAVAKTAQTSWVPSRVARSLSAGAASVTVREPLMAQMKGLTSTQCPWHILKVNTS